MHANSSKGATLAVPMPHFTLRSALVSCDSDDLILHPMLFHLSSTSTPFVRPPPPPFSMALMLSLPRRREASANQEADATPSDVFTAGQVLHATTSNAVETGGLACVGKQVQQARASLEAVPDTPAFSQTPLARVPPPCI
jgi:hypothetical protein